MPQHQASVSIEIEGCENQVSAICNQKNLTDSPDNDDDDNLESVKDASSNVSLANDINGNAVPCESRDGSYGELDNDEGQIEGSLPEISTLSRADDCGSSKEIAVQEKKITRVIYRRNRRKGFNWTLRKGGRRLSKNNSNVNVITNFKSRLIFKLGKKHSEVNITKPEKCVQPTIGVGGSKITKKDEKTNETEELVTSTENSIGYSNEVTTILPNLKDSKVDATQVTSVTPSLASMPLNNDVLKKQKPEHKKLLFHYEIMQKCLNKKILHKALQGDNNEFKCPMCDYRSSRPYAQYLLLHLKSHSDLTPIFELYQNCGGSLENDTQQKSSNDCKVNDDSASKPKRRRRKRVFSIARGDTSTKTTTSAFPKRSKITTEVSFDDNQNSSSENMTAENSTSCATARNTVLRKQQYAQHAIELAKRRRRSKKIVSLKANLRKDFLTVAGSNSLTSPSGNTGRGRPFISHIQGLDPELLKTLQEEIKNKVTEQNPHSCKFCGKIFNRGTGIYAHYFNKHAKYADFPKKPLDQDLNSETKSHAVASLNSSKCRRRDGIRSGSDDDQNALKELEDNLNALLQMLIRDHEVLHDLGWPNRNVSDLIIDILERCGLQPISQNVKNVSILQCLHQNVRQLFNFCIKESAMEQYGWNKKLIEDVVRDLIAANCF